MDDFPNSAGHVLAPVSAAYADRLRQFGAQPLGVFTRTREGQLLRLDVLLEILDPADREGDRVVINDLGCGYGTLFDHVRDRPWMRHGRYMGYDLCADMVRLAEQRHPDARAAFIEATAAIREAEYSLVSGTYNLKLEADDEQWLAMTLDSLAHLWTRTRKGLAFNMTSIHEQESQPGLYYGDPGLFFDFCMRTMGPRVALRHDYGLKEWAIYVRR